MKDVIDVMALQREKSRITPIDYILAPAHSQAVHFIFECGIKLNAQPVTVATAAALFHKFFKEVDKNSYDCYVSTHNQYKYQVKMTFSLILSKIIFWSFNIMNQCVLVFLMSMFATSDDTNDLFFNLIWCRYIIPNLIIFASLTTLCEHISLLCLFAMYRGLGKQWHISAHF